ncbi:MAG: HIT family protein [Candidatus Micrarchaeia archaeon]
MLVAKNFSKNFLHKTLIQQGRRWDIHLHPNQRNLGRSFICLKKSKFDFFELTAFEFDDLKKTVKKLVRALTVLFKPDLFNYAFLGNKVRRLHLHVVPRYKTPRKIMGVKFIDKAWGQNYAKAPVKTLNSRKFMQLKEAIRTAVVPFGEDHLSEVELVNRKLDKIDKEIRVGKTKLLNADRALGVHSKHVK